MTAAKRVTRRRRFSNRMKGGIIFMATGLVGGFVSSVGADIYHALSAIAISNSNFPLTLPQLVFMIIGIVGLGLLLSTLFGPGTGQLPQRRKTT